MPLLPQYERFVLSACLIDRLAAKQVVTELSDSAFVFGADDKSAITHQLIYRAIMAIVLEGNTPDVGTVAGKLGEDLSRVGGVMYLTKLSQALAEAGIHSTAGLPSWANTVDQAGRLRNMYAVLSTRCDQIKDIERAIQEIDDPEMYLADVIQELGTANTIRQEYNSAMDTVAKAREMLQAEARGQVISWLSMGWPSMDKYKFLPYESLFVLMGMSSMGKSQLLAEFLLGSAIQLQLHNLLGINVLNTYEMSAKRYVLRMAACLSRVNLQRPEVQDESSKEYRAIQDALDLISTLPIYFNDGDMTTQHIITGTKLLEAQHGRVHVVGIDYSELVPNRNKRSEEQRLAGIFRDAQRLSRSKLTGACVIVLSQFSNEVNQDPSKLGANCIPRYSGVGQHAAEIQAIVYNPPQMDAKHITYVLPDGLDKTRAYLYITKNKEGELGWVPMGWTPGCTRFSDPQLTGFGMDTLFRGLQEVRQDMLEVQDDNDF